MQKTQKSQKEKKNEKRRINLGDTLLDFATCLQGIVMKNAVLALGQTYGSMEHNGESRKKPKHIRLIDLQQKCQGNSIEKG